MKPRLTGRRRLGSAALVLMSATTFTSTMRGSETGSKVRQKQRPDYAVQIGIGIGVGDVGLGGRLTANGELWPSSHFGLGLEGGAIAQIGFLVDGRGALFAAPFLAYRTHATGSTWRWTLGSGYASATGGEEAASRRSNSVLLTTSAGYIYRSEHLHVGPTLMLDVVLPARARERGGRGQILGTLNLLLGFGG